MKMNLLLPVLMLTLTSYSFAHQSGGTITKLYVSAYGLALFSLSNEANNKPACATNSTWQYAIDLNSGSGKEMYSFLLTAKARNIGISVGYNEGCHQSFPAIKADFVFSSE